MLWNVNISSKLSSTFNVTVPETQKILFRNWHAQVVATCVTSSKEGEEGEREER